MEKITPIILSYNLPEETDEIHKKLVFDGFKDIVVVDNGSDKRPPAQSANLLLPKNIRFNGQARIALIYCMDYFPADYYWLITTSAVLLNKVDYMERIQQAFDNLSMIKVGILTPSIVGGDYFDLPCQKYAGNEDKNYSTCDPIRTQLIGALISHNLLEICRGENAAFFNLDLYRGHGTEMELCYVGLKNDFWPIVDYNMQIKWMVNNTHARGVDVESREDYHKLAAREYANSFNKKYGRYWEHKFNRLYLIKLKELKNFRHTKYRIKKNSTLSLMKKEIWRYNKGIIRRLRKYI